MTTNTQFPPVNFVVREISYIFRVSKHGNQSCTTKTNKQTNKQFSPMNCVARDISLFFRRAKKIAQFQEHVETSHAR